MRTGGIPTYVTGNGTDEGWRSEDDTDPNMRASSIPSHPLPLFTVDMGIIYPLFSTACKCRDGLLKRRAIHELVRAGSEGLCSGNIMAAAAHW